MYDEMFMEGVHVRQKQELLDYLFMLEDLLQDLLIQTRTITGSMHRNGS